MPRRRRQKCTNIVILAMSLALPQLSIDLCLPLESQGSLSGYLLGLGLAQLGFGPYADKAGRIKTLNLGCLVFLLGSSGCFLAGESWQLVAGRFIQGVGAAGFAIHCWVAVREEYNGDELAQVLSWIALLWTQSLILAPSLGIFVARQLGWRWNFLVLQLFALATTLLARTVLSPPGRSRENWLASKSLSEYVMVSKHPAFLVYACCSLCIYCLILVHNFMAPQLLQIQLGASSWGYSWYAALTGTAFAVGLLLNTKLVVRWGSRRILTVGFLALLLSTATFLVLAHSVAFSIWLLLSPMSLIMALVGTIFPTCNACLFSSFPLQAGVVAALKGATQMLGGATVITLLTVLPQYSTVTLVTALFVLSGTALAAFFCDFKRNTDLEWLPQTKLISTYQQKSEGTTS